MASANQSIPFVVSSQVVLRPESITQEKLAYILTVRQQIEALEQELGEAQADVQAALQSGAEVEPGIFRASLKVTERRSVAWKQVCDASAAPTIAHACWPRRSPTPIPIWS